MTRAYNTATTQQNTGGAVNPFTVGKNKIINGDFGIWQRGTSFNATSGVFTADRWLSYQDAGTGTTTQQTFTPGTAPVSGYEGTYFIRSAKTSTASGTHVPVYQRIEDARTFAGQTATLSFWAKADATTVVTPTIYRNYGSGGSATESFTASSVTLTTSWARYSATFSIPNVSGKTIGTGSHIEPQPIRVTDSLTHTFDIWGVQMEAGSVATPFQTATGTIQGELAAASRYYWRTPLGPANGTHGVGMAYGAAGTSIAVPLPVQMRVAPTSVDFSTLSVYDTGTITAVTGLTLNGGQTSYNTGFVNPTVSGGLTQYRTYFLMDTNSNGYIGFNAELQEMTMDNVTFVTDEQGTEHAIIDRGNGEFTSMLKSTYDEMIAAQATQPAIQSLIGTLSGVNLDRVTP